jgi:hypothetical protein
MNERVKYKEGKVDGNLDGLGHHRNGRTGQRDIIKGQACIKFVSKCVLKEDEYMPSVQSLEAPRSKPGGSGVWKPRSTEKPEVPGKFPEVPGSVRTEPRRKTRFNNDMLPRHLTLVCRSRTIQSSLEGICPSTRTRLMHLETYLLAMCRDATILVTLLPRMLQMSPTYM